MALRSKRSRQSRRDRSRTTAWRPGVATARAASVHLVLRRRSTSSSAGDRHHLSYDSLLTYDSTSWGYGHCAARARGRAAQHRSSLPTTRQSAPACDDDAHSVGLRAEPRLHGKWVRAAREQQGLQLTPSLLLLRCRHQILQGRSASLREPAAAGLPGRSELREHSRLGLGRSKDIRSTVIFIDRSRRGWSAPISTVVTSIETICRDRNLRARLRARDPASVLTPNYSVGDRVDASARLRPAPRADERELPGRRRRPGSGGGRAAARPGQPGSGASGGSRAAAAHDQVLRDAGGCSCQLAGKRELGILHQAVAGWRCSASAPNCPMH